MAEPSAARENPLPQRPVGAADSADPSTLDPTDTDHPTGADQAAENAATESPS